MEKELSIYPQSKTFNYISNKKNFSPKKREAKGAVRFVKKTQKTCLVKKRPPFLVFSMFPKPLFSENTFFVFSVFPKTIF